GVFSATACCCSWLATGAGELDISLRGAIPGVCHCHQMPPPTRTMNPATAAAIFACDNRLRSGEAATEPSGATAALLGIEGKAWLDAARIVALLCLIGRARLVAISIASANAAAVG